jgi:drug/metabolite transporter (DMT)-like permease
MRPVHWGLLVVTALSFASSVVLNKMLVGALPPLTLAASRVALALPLCLLVLRWSGARLPATRADRLTVLKAAFGVIIIPYCALAVGQQTIGGGLSGILYSTMPLFTLLAAHLMLHDERLGIRKIAGAALGIGGVVFVLGPSLLGGLGDHLAAELITLVGPLAYAIASVLMRRSRWLEPIGLTAGLFIAAASVLVPLSLVIDRPWTLSIDAAALWGLLALAVFGTILPAALNYLLLQRVGATRASIAMFLMPFFAIGLSALMFGERLGAGAWIGLALIVGGSLLLTAASAAPRPAGSADAMRAGASR